MSSFHSYSSIYNLGHKAVADLLKYPHYIEAKIDGSQFSFGVIDGVLRVRSKGAEMHVDAPEKMFTKAVDTAKRLFDQGLLHPEWTYRSEYLLKPKHNSLAYDRVPKDHLILFDVTTAMETWLTPEEKAQEAARLGLECVPVLLRDDVGGQTTLEQLRTILDTTTDVLGGQLIEGVVVKPLVPLFGIDKHTLMAKFVSERFREVHAHAWKENNPTTGDIIQRIADKYTTEGRWMKAVQHLREAGQLEDSPRDIGKLIKEVKEDVKREEVENIKEDLFKYAWSHIERKLTYGLPEWWKNELLRRQFEAPCDTL